MNRAIAASILVFILCVLTFGQSVQVNRDNRTISVTAEETVSAQPDIAIAKIAYRNFGTSKQAVYSENVRVAELVVKAFETAGVSKSNVETETLSFGRKNEDEEDRKTNREPRFEARQLWKIRLPAAQAQSVIDIAMRAGANEIEDVDWQVADPVALQAKAGAAALAKARRIAEQMAQGLGAKLGQLVFASNRAPVYGWPTALSTETVEVSAALAAPPPPPPRLTLYPKKVTNSATVYAVFAVE